MAGVKVSENLGATSVPPVAPVVTSLLRYKSFIPYQPNSHSLQQVNEKLVEGSKKAMQYNKSALAIRFSPFKSYLKLV